MKDKNTHIIIFKDPNENADFNYGWLIASPHKPEPIEYIADKRVPAGMPYLIVTQSLMPVNFWNEMGNYTIDFSNPDGIGSGSFRYKHDGVDYTIDSVFTGSYNDWKEVHNV